MNMKKGIFVKLAGFDENCWSSEFEFAKELKCDHVEFVLDYPLLGPSIYKKETLEKIKKMTGNLKLIVHLMPHRYNQIPELKDKFFDLASLDQDIRKFSMEEVKKSFEMARELGAEIVTVHGGFSENKKFYNENLQILKKSLEELNNFAGGIKLCIENMPTRDHLGNYIKEIPSSPEDLLFLIKDLENIGITLDIGHANTIMSPKEFFNKSKKVWNIHVHDNCGKDDHLPLGKGCIDFKGFLKELKNKNYQGYFSLELDINWDESKLKTPSKTQRRMSWEFLKNFNL